jgi:periplasmic protein TonB
MFEQALLESARHAPGTQRTCSTAASLLIQAATLATFIIVPMLATHIAPQLERRMPVVVPPLESPAPSIEPSGTSVGTSSFSTAPSLVQPRRIGVLDRGKPDVDTHPVSVHTDEGGGGKLSDLFAHSGPGMTVGGPVTKPPIVSVLESGLVITRVQPIYPQIAIQNRVQGSVHLHAIITPRGSLDELRVLSGHPMLARAALEAVEQWKFRPYVLNGKPIEVQTEVIVNFSLN